VEFIIVGIITALNVLFIKMKFDKHRYEVGVFDLVLLVVITVIFSGSYGALVVGMVASLIISISFYANPPNFLGPLAKKVKAELKEAQKRNGGPAW